MVSFSFLVYISCYFSFLLQNLPVGADCVGSLKLTYISKVKKNDITTESNPTQI